MTSSPEEIRHLMQGGDDRPGIGRPALVQLPCCDPARPLRCSKCGALAVLPLDAVELAKQPDDTTHVCHPLLRGCNHGFALDIHVRMVSPIEEN